MKGRFGTVAAVALLAAALPIGVAWVASRTPVAPGQADRAANLLVTALFEAPVALVLGALAGLLLARRSAALVRRPAAAGLGAALSVAGTIAAAYFHATARARLAGAPGLPPFAMILQFSDLARAAPLIPAGAVLGGVLAAAAGARHPVFGPLAAFGTGLAIGLGSGIAVLVVAGPVRVAGPAALLVELLLALAVVWLLARRTGDRAG